MPAFTGAALLLALNTAEACACDTVYVGVSGDAATNQGDTAGAYVRTNSTESGRAVYKQDDDGSNLLYYWSDDSWRDGPDFTSSGLKSEGVGSECPEDAGPWDYYDGDSWQTGGVQVSCSQILLAPPPPPPPPSPDDDSDDTDPLYGLAGLLVPILCVCYCCKKYRSTPRQQPLHLDYSQHQDPAPPPPVAVPIPPPSVWDNLAKGIDTEDKLRSLFARRQSTQRSRDPKLQILQCIKINHEHLLEGFQGAGAKADPDPKKAYGKSGDTFLFHGAREDLVPNIQAEGLKLSFAGTSHGTMLGNGIYGAPDPRKSLQYCTNPQHGTFMFVCRFSFEQNVDKYAQNKVYDEFCIFDDKRVVVLWMIKVE